ncbi:MAG: hypothetical protein M3Z20_21310, partial [Chloroflexota bacterium]|nr:hypothetical protein [Chloroflexota bacterium]
MDANRFDHLTRWVSAGGSRRKILALLSGLPLGGVAALLAGDELAAAKRRKPKSRQRKQRDQQRQHRPSQRQDVADEAQPHKKHCRRVKGKGHGHHGRRKNCQAHHGGKGKNKGKGRDKQPACQPESLAQTCADTCGAVQNNCQQAVDCGSCTCQPTCPICQRCNESTTRCEPDDAQVGDPCGDGLLCQDDGQCACQGDSCGGCRACEDGRCVVDTSIVCTAQDDCHEAGVCDPATGACTNPARDDGTSCDDGDPCTSADTCQRGVCTGGTAKDCSGAADVCHDGVCRSSDGACIK